MATKIKASLSPSSLKKMSSDLKKYRKEFLEKNKIFIEELAKEGVILMRGKVPSRTGTLRDSIEYVAMDSTGKSVRFAIMVRDGKAGFVEFGTGMVGSQKVHPTAQEVGWEYDINEHGDDGWVYPEVDENGKKVFWWTMGQVGSQFVYLTGKELADRVRIVASRVFV